MIPRTYPSTDASNGQPQLIGYYLSSVIGLTRWVDYIPVRFNSYLNGVENNYNLDGYIPVTTISSITGLTPFKDYVPLYIDNTSTDVWTSNVTGYVPIGLRKSVNASLELDFTKTEVLDSRITFTRASSATVTNSSGLIVPAAFNLLPYSEQFDNASWVKTNATVNSNVIVSPDGATSSDKLVEDTTANAHTIGQAYSFVAGTTYVTSVYAKLDESNRRIQIVFPSVAFTTTGRACFNLTTGIVTTSASVSSASLVNVGNGWYRCTATATATTTVSGNLRLTLANSDSANLAATEYTGDGTSGVFIWGAQLNTGILSSYSPTVATSSFGPRFDYDGATLAPKGLLIEEQRTNLLTYSDQFDNVAWTKTRATITANAVTSPDGTVNADKLIEDTSAGTHSARNATSVTITSGTTLTATVYAKAAESASICVGIGDGAGINISRATFNLSTQAITFITTAAANVSTPIPLITPVGNGWFRCSVTATVSNVTTAQAWYFRVSSGGGISYTGDGVSGIYIWGAQLETGTFPTSYIPTVASQVTRIADSAVMTGTNFSSWYNAVEGTLYSVASTLDVTAARIGVAITDGTNNNRIQNGYGTAPLAFVSASGTSQMSQGFGSITPVNNVFSKVSLAYKLNNGNAAVNNTLGTLNTSLTVPVVDRLQLGNLSVGTGSNLNGNIRKIAYYPIRLSDSELREITI